MTAEEFYLLRDCRSKVYLSDIDLAPKPIAIEWGQDAANTVAGQTLLFSLVNQVARFCRRASFVGPDASRIAPSLCAVSSLSDTVFALATQIDPYGEWSSSRLRDPAMRIAVGSDVTTGDLFVTAEGWSAYLSSGPTAWHQFSESDVPGAAAASCLAAANAFKASVDVKANPFIGQFSLWTMNTGNFGQGPRYCGGVNIGNVVMAGAGAVGAAAAYWMRVLDIRGNTDVIDRDYADIPNTNRGLLLTSQDGGLGKDAEPKASVVAQWLGNATPHQCWYDEFPHSRHRWDVYLPLANDRDARTIMQSDYPPIMLHATTNTNWETFSHRHRPAVDECIVCRFPGSLPVLRCSRGEAETTAGLKRNDAALPFMSAAAGLMLAADLVRLGIGELDNPCNMSILNWRWGLRCMNMRATCARGCQQWGDPNVRRLLNSNTKWYDIET